MSILRKAELTPTRLYAVPLLAAISIGSVVLTVKLVTTPTCTLSSEPAPVRTKIELVSEPAPVKLVIQPPAQPPAVDPNCCAPMSF